MVCMPAIGKSVRGRDWLARLSPFPLPLSASFFRLFRSRFPVFVRPSVSPVRLPSFLRHKRKLSLAAVMPGWTKANRQRGEEYQKGVAACRKRHGKHHPTLLESALHQTGWGFK